MVGTSPQEAAVLQRERRPVGGRTRASAPSPPPPSSLLPPSLPRPFQAYPPFLSLCSSFSSFRRQYKLPCARVRVSVRSVCSSCVCVCVCSCASRVFAVCPTLFKPAQSAPSALLHRFFFFYVVCRCQPPCPRSTCLFCALFHFVCCLLRARSALGCYMSCHPHQRNEKKRRMKRGAQQQQDKKTWVSVPCRFGAGATGRVHQRTRQPCNGATCRPRLL